MAYVDGFVVAVPAANKEAYRKHATDALPLFKEFGVTRLVEAWGDDLPRGTNTDFFMAVKAEDGENVVFSWIFWPSKAERDAAWEKIMKDERMQPPADMPMDGKRMFWGGFAPILEA